MNLVRSSLSYNNEKNKIFVSAAHATHSLTMCTSNDFSTEVFDDNPDKVLSEENYKSEIQIINDLCVEMESEKLFHNSNVTEMQL